MDERKRQNEEYREKILQQIGEYDHKILVLLEYLERDISPVHKNHVKEWREHIKNAQRQRAHLLRNFAHSLDLPEGYGKLPESTEAEL